MKLVLSLVCCVCLCAVAPLVSRAQVRFGLKAGVQQTFITYPTVQPGTAFGKRIAYQAGLVFDCPLSRSFSVQPSLLLSSKGATFTGSVISGTTNVVIGPNETIFRPLYVELPVLLMYRFSVATRTRLLVGAGPYGAVGVGGRMYRNILYTEYDEPMEFAPKGSGTRFQRFDYGLTGAAGVELGRVQLTLTYSQGLTNVTTFIVNTDLRNQALALTASFLLGEQSKQEAPVYFHK